MLKKMITLPFILLLTITITIAQSCDTTEPKIEENIIIQEVDVAVKEAYIHIKLNSQNPDQQIILKRDGKEVVSFNGGIKDTIVTDTNLTRNTSYSYSAILIKQNETVGKSNNITLTTLEVTSHDFTWETHTFGDYQSFLYDVALVEDTDGGYQIWAVGEVYLEDENGNYDSQPYGLVRWNGQEWDIAKTKFRQYNQTVLRPGIAKTILSFGEDNNYLCSSSSLVQWHDDDITEKAYFLEKLPFSGQVSCMWGTDENNIYLGSGSDGTLYHYYGEGWNKLDAGSINGGITDIFGYQSPIDNKWNIFATVTFVAKPSDHKLLSINEDNSISQYPWMEEERISSVWTRNGLPIYTAGNGVHIWRGKKWDKIQNLPTKFAGHVSGTSLNNVFVVGDFNMILHYNGETWQVIEDNSNGWYQTVKVKENIIVMVGTKDGKGIVKIGKK